MILYQSIARSALLINKNNGAEPSPNDSLIGTDLKKLIPFVANRKKINHASLTAEVAKTLGKNYFEAFQKLYTENNQRTIFELAEEFKSNIKQVVINAYEKEKAEEGISEIELRSKIVDLIVFNIQKYFPSEPTKAATRRIFLKTPLNLILEMKEDDYEVIFFNSVKPWLLFQAEYDKDKLLFEMLKAISKTKSLQSYKSYLALSSFLFRGDMQTAYTKSQKACKAYGISFAKLNFGAPYLGRVYEYRKDLANVNENFDRWLESETPESKTPYTELPSSLKGFWGCMAYAEVECQGALQVAYRQMRTICNAAGKEFKDLGWSSCCFGNAKDFRQDLEELRHNFGTWTKSEALESEKKYTRLPEGLQGIWGHIAYAELKHGGNLQTASKQMSLFCKIAGLNFKDLKWESTYVGNAREFRADLKLLRKEFENWVESEALESESKYTVLPPNLKGIWGYVAYAEVKCSGNMQVAYKEMKALCKTAGKSFEDLEWGGLYRGKSGTFRDSLQTLKKDFDIWTELETLESESKYKKLPRNLKGLWGYVAYAEVECDGDMTKAYKQMSTLCKAVGVNFKKLEWGTTFPGKTKEFRSNLKLLKKSFEKWLEGETLRKENYTQLPKNLKGIWGYVAYAEAKCDGNMEKAFKQISSLCKAAKLRFEDLEWGCCFKKNTKAFRLALETIEKNFETWTGSKAVEERKYKELPEGLKGLWGYVAYAEVHCNGNMQQAFTEMSLLCKAVGKDFKKLAWGNGFRGDTKEFRSSLKLFEKKHKVWLEESTPESLKKYKKLPKHLKGIWGYVAYADVKCQGGMSTAYARMSSICKALGYDFENFEWLSEYIGSTEEFRQNYKYLKDNYDNWLKSESLEYKEKYTDLPENLKGIWGYLAYAEAKCDGNMLVAYSKMSCLCRASGKDFKSLGWGYAYPGSSKDFRLSYEFAKKRYKTWISKEASEIRGRYKKLPEGLKGIWGYIAYADVECLGNMKKAYIKMSALCNALGIDFDKLGWGKVFQGSTREFRVDLKILRNQYKTWTSKKAPEIQEQYKELPKFLKGIWGYIAYAEAECKGSLHLAYSKMSTLCNTAGVNFKDLEWGNRYHGSTQGFRSMLGIIRSQYQNWIKSKPLEPEEKYISLPLNLKGIWGYVAFAEVKCGGNMQKAFTKMNILCNALGVDFKSLGWGDSFQGSVKEFRVALKNIEAKYQDWVASYAKRSQARFTQLPKSLKGVWGYIAYAETQCNGNMQRAYSLMNTVCKAAGRELKLLDWGTAYRGNSNNFRLYLDRKEKLEKLSKDFIDIDEDLANFAVNKLARELSVSLDKCSEILKDLHRICDVIKLEIDLKQPKSIKDLELILEEINLPKVCLPIVIFHYATNMQGLLGKTPMVKNMKSLDEDFRGKEGFSLKDVLHSQNRVKNSISVVDALYTLSEQGKLAHYLKAEEENRLVELLLNGFDTLGAKEIEIFQKCTDVLDEYEIYGGILN